MSSKAPPSRSTYGASPYTGPAVKAVRRDKKSGFVAGVLSRNKVLTDEERRSGKEGFTPQEWKALSARKGGATLYPLRLDHQQEVGNLLHTYVDDEGQLCVTAQFDMETEAGRRAFEDAEAGKLHSLSIGFRSMPGRDWDPEGGNARYINFDLEASLTDNPVDPSAIIKVVCSNNVGSLPTPPTTMTTTMDVDAPAAAAAATPIVPAVVPMPSIAELQARLAQQQPAAAAPVEQQQIDPALMARAMELMSKQPRELVADVVRVTEEKAKLEAEAAALKQRLAQAEENEKYVTEARLRKQNKREKLRQAKLEEANRQLEEHKAVLKEAGVDITDELQKKLLQELASHDSSAPVLAALTRLAQETSKARAEMEELRKRAELQQTVKELLRGQAAGSSYTGLTSAQQQPGGDGKRAAVAAASSSTTPSHVAAAAPNQPVPASTTQSAASMLNLDQLDQELMRLLQARKAAGAALTAAAPAPAAAAAAAAAGQPANLDEARRQIMEALEQAPPILQELLDAQTPVERSKLLWEAIKTNTSVPVTTKCSITGVTPERVYTQTSQAEEGVPFMPSQWGAFFFQDVEYYRDLARKPDVVRDWLPRVRFTSQLSSADGVSGMVGTPLDLAKLSQFAPYRI